MMNIRSRGIHRFLVAVVIQAGLWATSCGDGPAIIDHPDYSAFFDRGIADDANQRDSDTNDRDSAEPGDTPGEADFLFPVDAVEAVPGDTGPGTDTVGAADIPDTTDTRPDDDTWPDAALTDTEDQDAVWTDTWSDLGPETAADSGPDFGTGEYTGLYEGMDDLAGVALVQAICPLVRNGTTTVSYTNAKTLLRTEVDLYDDRIQEIYTGLWYDPDDSLINVEHTWPQSKGAGSAPAQGDMHHLYLANSYYNSARSNFPYGTVSTITYYGPDGNPVGDPDCTDVFPESGESGCFSYVGDDSLGQRVAEPRDAHKGNVARAVFYFQLRYGTSNCSLKPLSDWDTYGAAHVAMTEETLKQWNRLDPPDEHERDRNGRIELREGVRNPFIDHPEFVDRIDFTP